MLCRNCYNKNFVLTETIMIKTSMLIDSLIDNNPEIKSNTVIRQYTLICTNCGQIYTYEEIDNEDIPEFVNLQFDAEKLISEIFEKGKIRKDNKNF